MKKIICIMVACSLLLAGGVLAIDKSKKDVTPDSTAVKTEPAPVDDNQTKADSNQKFDNFIDNNSNGIDDRAEKNKPAPPKKEKAEPEKTEPKTP